MSDPFVSSPSEATRLQSAVVAVAGRSGEPGDLLHGLRETGAVGPRAGETEGGHPPQDGTRFQGLHALSVESEVREDVRREARMPALAPPSRFRPYESRTATCLGATMIGL
jgi:hypothetical protein